MASVKKKNTARKSKFAGQIEAYIKVTHILMERQQMLEYLVSYIFAFDLTKRSAEHAKAFEDGIDVIDVIDVRGREASIE